MKNLFLAILCITPFWLIAQNTDSLAAAKQVDSLIQVSRALTDKRDLDKAFEVNAAAEALALKQFGRESAAYGSCCSNRGRVKHFKRDYPGAEKWYLDSKVIREKSLGKEHPDYASSLNNMANLYKNLGQYDKVEPLLLESNPSGKRLLELSIHSMQRAFKIAGAKYLIMSLWQVPDRETMEFMTTFYKHWLEGKMTIPDAFRTTQKEMRERFINPYQWAGFVLVE